MVEFSGKVLNIGALNREPLFSCTPLGYKDNDRVIAGEWDDTSESNLTPKDSAVSSS